MIDVFIRKRIYTRGDRRRGIPDSGQRTVCTVFCRISAKTIIASQLGEFVQTVLDSHKRGLLLVKAKQNLPDIGIIVINVPVIQHAIIRIIVIFLLLKQALISLYCEV
jgi:hypothetical protein